VPPKANKAGYGTPIRLARADNSTAPSRMPRIHSKMSMGRAYIMSAALGQHEELGQREELRQRENWGNAGRGQGAQPHTPSGLAKKIARFSQQPARWRR
jgi:hypothetical protein